MRNIHLHGTLGDKYVKTIQLDVQTAGEAVRALCANFKGIYEDIRDGAWHVVRGSDLKSGMELGEEDINSFRLGSGDLHIVPAVAGSKQSSGLLKVILGVALIGVGFFMGGFAAPLLGSTVGGALGLTYGHLAMFGAAMALGGVSQMLAPEEKTSEDRESSYAFSGPGNTYEQGYPVPLVYGEVITGSVMISAGVDVEKIRVGDPDPQDPGSTPGWAS